MKNEMKHLFFLPGFLICLSIVIKAQNIETKGQLASVFQHADNGSLFNFRYLPGCSIDYQLTDTRLLNGEAYVNGRYTTDFSVNSLDLELYRAIIRYTTEQSETQLGLQKINFGPAQLLRSLMWFDSVDPRDPLKLTNGVYGLRYKYSFLDNSNVWLWGLIGNTALKGMETLPTEKKQPEFGGRFQLPVFSGEFATTFHSRRVNTDASSYQENRIAFDGKWDIEVGVWGEAVFQKNETDIMPNRWSNMETIGADYTLPYGNGVYILLEHMNIGAGNNFPGTNDSREISAMMLTYQVTILDNFSAIGYYDWGGHNFFQYYQVQRTYDVFSFIVSLFHYPQKANAGLLQGTIPVAGFGFQLMGIYNF